MKRRPTDGSLAQRFLNSMLWKDTKATARRFFFSMVLLIPAVLLGLHMGLFPVCRRVLPALRALLRQDRGALAAADSVHRVRHR